MRTMLITALALWAGAITLQAQDSLHIDTDILFPNVGTGIVLIDPNDFGVPPGLIQTAGVTLINDRVVLTVANLTKNTEGGLPPFIHVFVTFNSQLLADRSSWIPVTASAWHPTFTVHCAFGICDIPPGFPYPTPGMSDVGLMLLEKPVKDIKPTDLARPRTLETGRGDSQDQIFVSYRPPAFGRRHYRVPPPKEIFYHRWALGGVGGACFNHSGGPTF